MAAKSHKPKPKIEKEPAKLAMESFTSAPTEDGLSLDKLSAAFAEMLKTGDDPYPEPSDDVEPLGLPGEVDSTAPGAAAPEAVAATQTSPQTILEALLFVGSPQNEPLTSQQIAGLMRGVRPAEIDAQVAALNQQYDLRRCPYRIESHGAGYRLVLRGDFGRLRDKFFGRAKQARLSHAAIEVLAAVAYHGPLTADEVNKLRGTPSGAILSQLVRRELLRIDRPDRKHQGKYSTTSRFLELFRLNSLEDLPRSQELGTE